MSDSRAFAYTFGDGRKEVAVAGTAEQLSSTSVPCKQVTITAETNNTNPVTVGASTVVGALLTRRGIPLTAGSSITVECTNLNQIYVDVITNTEGVTYFYVI